MSDTPRTDLHVLFDNYTSADRRPIMVEGADVVTAAFARELEREINDGQARYAALSLHTNIVSAENALRRDKLSLARQNASELERENARLRKLLEGIRDIAKRPLDASDAMDEIDKMLEPTTT